MKPKNSMADVYRATINALAPVRRRKQSTES